MKLRYYLRGLGVGLLVATLVLTAANAGKRPLTDAEVRARAAELGMVDSDSVKLPAVDKNPVSQKEPESDKQAAVTPEEKKTPTDDTPAEKKTPTDNAPAEKETPADNASADQDVEKETPGGDAPEDVAQDAEPEENNAQEEREPVTFVIRGGMGSYSVSKALEEAGLVANAGAYDDFLCSKGYSGKIRTGTYEIMPGTSEEDIAKMIAN